MGPFYGELDRIEMGFHCVRGLPLRSAMEWNAVGSDQAIPGHSTERMERETKVDIIM